MPCRAVHSSFPSPYPLNTTTKQLSSDFFGCGPRVSGTAAVPSTSYLQHVTPSELRTHVSTKEVACLLPNWMKVLLGPRHLRADLKTKKGGGGARIVLYALTLKP